VDVRVDQLVRVDRRRQRRPPAQVPGLAHWPAA
jgi:hypothetical protein